jgi:benzodiazapine receptor
MVYATMKPNALQQGIGLAAFILVCFAAAGVGGLVTTPNIPTWYASLAKPTWTPPDWVFGPVWSLLYLMMATSAWLVWRQTGLAGAKLSLGLFAVQLVLNSLWSVLFFGLQSPGAALVEIILLWVAILATMIVFWGRSRLAGGLLAPCLAWLSFAAVLNFAIWRLNA